MSRCNLKSRGHGKLSIHFAADYPTIETVFRILVSANQLSLHGAVANMCEEFETHQCRSGQLDVLTGQSIVLSEIKAEVPLENDIPSHQNLLLQRYEERIKLLSPENKVSKFCMDARFIHVVEVGQHFMTKDTGDFRKFRAVACEVPADILEEQASQSIVKVFAARSKAKAKPQRTEPVDVQSIIPMNERKWINIEPGESSFSACEISKKVINLFRHSQTVQREDDGAVLLSNNADRDCFKTLTLQEILRVQNPLLEEHCSFLEVIHLFP